MSVVFKIKDYSGYNAVVSEFEKLIHRLTVYTPYKYSTPGLFQKGKYLMFDGSVAVKSHENIQVNPAILLDELIRREIIEFFGLTVEGVLLNNSNVERLFWKLYNGEYTGDGCFDSVKTYGKNKKTVNAKARKGVIMYSLKLHRLQVQYVGGFPGSSFYKNVYVTGVIPRSVHSFEYYYNKTLIEYLTLKKVKFNVSVSEGVGGSVFGIFDPTVRDLGDFEVSIFTEPDLSMSAIAVQVQSNYTYVKDLLEYKLGSMPKENSSMEGNVRICPVGMFSSKRKKTVRVRRLSNNIPSYVKSKVNKRGFRKW